MLLVGNKAFSQPAYVYTFSNYAPRRTELVLSSKLLLIDSPYFMQQHLTRVCHFTVIYLPAIGLYWKERHEWRRDQHFPRNYGRVWNREELGHAFRGHRGCVGLRQQHDFCRNLDGRWPMRASRDARQRRLVSSDGCPGVGIFVN